MIRNNGEAGRGISEIRGLFFHLVEVEARPESSVVVGSGVARYSRYRLMGLAR